MRKACLSLLVVLTLGGGAAAAFATEPIPDLTPTPATVPPALQALEQKVAQIHFSTARLSERFVIGELGSPAGGAELGRGVRKGKSFITLGSGVMQLEPFESLITSRVEIPGEHVPSAVGATGQARTIGKVTYSYSATAARIDGGRPWVRSVRKPPPKPDSKLAAFAAAIDLLAPTTAGSEQNPSAPFATLLECLGEATGIQEGGVVTVDGQQTTEFTVSLPIIKLLVNKVAPKELAKLERQIDKKPAEANVQLEVFFAANGLPVRTIGITGSRLEGLGIETDLLALEVPVVVHSPPASQTIGEARLAKIEQRQAKRAERRLKRILRHCRSSRSRKRCVSRAIEQLS